ncbi:hypothetical protein C8R47DRAFT_1083757 [Mycena vitilis]|nr:hypothetical protein C8R47DRAFT_1083757 [Mycena vitilis]
MSGKSTFLSLLSDLESASHDGPNCQETLSRAENMEMELGSLYPWPTSLPEILRNLEVHDYRLEDGPERAGFLSQVEGLRRKWERIRVAAVGYKWCQLFPLGVQLPSSCPPEILHEVMVSHVADTHGTPEKDWGEHADFLCSCARVSKHWNPVASTLLYHGCIRLATKSATELLRTLSDRESRVPTVQHVVLAPPYNETGFPQVATRLLAHCPDLRILQLCAGCEFLEPITGRFSNLQSLHLRSINLRLFAPFLADLPKLSILRLEEVEIFSGRQHAFVVGTEPPGDDLASIPTPVYHLEEFHVIGAMLTGRQVRWLLGASEILAHVELHGVYAPSLPSILGPLVKSARLTLGNSPSGDKDDHLARLIPSFTSLKSLSLVRTGWPWMSLLTSIASSLEHLSVSQSRIGIEALVTQLTDTSWQPQLNKVTVFRGNTDLASDTDDSLAEAETHPTTLELRRTVNQWAEIPFESVSSDKQAFSSDKQAYEAGAIATRGENFQQASCMERLVLSSGLTCLVMRGTSAAGAFGSDLAKELNLKAKVKLRTQTHVVPQEKRTWTHGGCGQIARVAAIHRTATLPPNQQRPARCLASMPLPPPRAPIIDPRRSATQHHLQLSWMFYEADKAHVRITALSDAADARDTLESRRDAQNDEAEGGRGREDGRRHLGRSAQNARDISGRVVVRASTGDAHLPASVILGWGMGTGNGTVVCSGVRDMFLSISWAGDRSTRHYPPNHGAKTRDPVIADRSRVVP